MSLIDCLRRPNFEPEDFFKSETAARNNINNTTDNSIIISNLSKVADKIQEIRNFLKVPVIVNSAYRCPVLNELINGKPNSQHCKGQAIDFIAPDFGNPMAIFLTLKKAKIEVDQCLLEKTWIHLSIKEKDNRNMWGKYIDGIFTAIKT